MTKCPPSLEAFRHEPADYEQPSQRAINAAQVYADIYSESECYSTDAHWRIVRAFHRFELSILAERDAANAMSEDKTALREALRNLVEEVEGVGGEPCEVSDNPVEKALFAAHQALGDTP